MARKKVVEPTQYEQAQIDKALLKKYPHMMTGNWAKMLKDKVRKRLTKMRRSTTYRLAQAGVPKKQAERLGSR